jgi:hypothetical protein
MPATSTRHALASRMLTNLFMQEDIVATSWFDHPQSAADLIVVGERLPPERVLPGRVLRVLPGRVLRVLRVLPGRVLPGRVLPGREPG